MSKRDYKAEFQSSIDDIKIRWDEHANWEFTFEARNAEAFCGSQVEQLLYMALFVKLRTDSYIASQGSPHYTLKPDTRDDDAEWILHPQCRIGRYRADFVLDVMERGQNQPRYIFVIEVDGHDFHQRTKEQAKHDKTRDRWMTEQGYTVVRFTGSEVWADPYDCAEQALTIARRKLKWHW